MPTPPIRQTIPSPSPVRSATRVATPLLVPLVATLLLLSGCATQGRTHTRSGLSARYAFRTLSTHLDPSVSVLTATAAAEQALRARGYAIDRSEATEDEAIVVARPAGGGEFDRAVVESRVTRTGTSLAVRIEPFGNEAASYAIMDAVLLRMGL